jgi:hypothetical protein
MGEERGGNGSWLLWVNANEFSRDLMRFEKI